MTDRPQRPSPTSLDAAIDAAANKHHEEVVHLRRRNTGLVRLVGLLVLALILAVGYIVAGRDAPAPQADPAAELRVARMMMYTFLVQIEAFRTENGRAPRDLAEVGMEVPEGSPIRYGTEGSDRYWLEMDMTGGPLRYTSGEDLTPYQEAATGS